MAPAPVDIVAAIFVWARAVVAIGLFGALFAGVLWTPGLLLAAFAAGLAADSHTLSQTLERRRRRSLIILEARPLRGGWVDSTVSRLG